MKNNTTLHTTFELTESQQERLRKLAFKVQDIIDDNISGTYLIPDELVDTDDWTEINTRKSVALEYIKSLL